jgi:pimeloyl-ACP methyl ester carboxylesterase
MSMIEPFRLAIPQEELDDLHRRLAATRLPEPATVDGWDQGVPLDRFAALLDHWKARYDWRRCEAMLNAFGQYRTEIDGLPIHFLHIRSPRANAMPLIMTHGWPGSVIEFHKVIGPLTDPVAHGGSEADAFHLVLPSLPGYGFSGKPARSGWGTRRIAAAWAVLMERLGYSGYGAQGGDWGSAVTLALGALKPAGMIGLHVNMLSVRPDKQDGPPDADERAAMERLQHYMQVEAGYARQQATRPQTLGYALADSPAGQAAWIFEKFQAWSDCDGDPATLFTADELLDNIMLYWLPNAGASSARLYWESMSDFDAPRIDLPVGVSMFPKEIIPTPRKWAEQRLSNIVHWGTPPKGGHFAALEQPVLFVDEVRETFRTIR